MEEPQRMEKFNDDRRDWQELYADLNQEFARGRLLDPVSLEQNLTSKVMGFFSLTKEDEERVSVSVNPFARKATIIIRPSDGVTFQAVAQLKDVLEFGMKINLKF